jgi:hypothetical protein
MRGASGNGGRFPSAKFLEGRRLMGFEKYFSNSLNV